MVKNLEGLLEQRKQIDAQIQVARNKLNQKKPGKCLAFLCKTAERRVVLLLPARFVQ